MTTHDGDGWSKITKAIVGLTGLLVVVPSLISSAIGIYDSVKKVPRNETERINVALFQKYFGKEPLSKIPPVNIKRNGENYQVQFDVYDEGDVFVKYGGRTQWFAFPGGSLPDNAASDFLIMNANAGNMYQPEIFSPYQQQDRIEGGNLYRTRLYESGAQELQIIDMRSGIVLKRLITQPSPPSGLPNAESPPPSPPPNYLKYQTQALPRFLVAILNFPNFRLSTLIDHKQKLQRLLHKRSRLAV